MVVSHGLADTYLIAGRSSYLCRILSIRWQDRIPKPWSGAQCASGVSSSETAFLMAHACTLARWQQSQDGILSTSCSLGADLMSSRRKSGTRMQQTQASTFTSGINFASKVTDWQCRIGR